MRGLKEITRRDAATRISCADRVRLVIIVLRGRGASVHSADYIKTRLTMQQILSSFLLFRIKKYGTDLLLSLFFLNKLGLQLLQKSGYKHKRLVVKTVPPMPAASSQRFPQFAPQILQDNDVSYS